MFRASEINDLSRCKCDKGKMDGGGSKILNNRNITLDYSRQLMSQIAGEQLCIPQKWITKFMRTKGTMLRQYPYQLELENPLDCYNRQIPHQRNGTVTLCRTAEPLLATMDLTMLVHTALRGKATNSSPAAPWYLAFERSICPI